MNEITKYRKHLIVPPDDINAVHEFMDAIWVANAHIPQRERIYFETALIELVGNIISYSVAKSDVMCEVVIETSENRIDATISDNGEMAEVELEGHEMPGEFEETGRGIALIKILVDEFSLDTSKKLNTWRLSKRFASKR